MSKVVASFFISLARVVGTKDKWHWHYPLIQRRDGQAVDDVVEACPSDRRATLVLNEGNSCGADESEGRGALAGTAAPGG
jgi:hypothetical protein